MGKSLQRQLIVAVLTIVIPLALLLMVNSLYFVNHFNQSIAESNRHTVNVGIEAIRSELAAIDKTLLSLIAGNADFMLLAGGASGLQSHLSSLRLIEELKAIMPAYPSVGAFYLYSVPSGVERDLFAGNVGYDKKTRLQAFVRDCAANDRIAYGAPWRYAEIDGDHYLFRFLGGRNTYIAAMTPLENLVRIAGAQIGGTTVTAFVSEDNLPLTQRDYIEENGISLDGGLGAYFFSGRPRHMVIGGRIGNTDCGMAILVKQAGYFDALNPVQIALLIISLLSVALIPLLVLWLKRSVLRPLEAIKGTMDNIRQGNLEAEIVQAVPIREFQQVNEMFREMMTQIKNLKIEAYEKMLETQRAELRYLHLQIRPHFFLNCLKSIYALSRQKQHEKQERMILDFSRHIMYIFRDAREVVPLREELEHVRNYMDIQSISAVVPPVLRIRVDPALEDFAIPPLSIQTFVENSVMYGVNPDKALEVEIRVSLLADGDESYIDIAVGDNGEGFPEDALLKVNQPDNGGDTQRHVGLHNVRRRIEMIYGSGAMFAFFNTGIGAVSEVFIPVDPARYRPGGQPVIRPLE